jgi:NAD(P)-dependent dehydrogenase (short-subunit alcohol dehydrogenase family)
MVSTKNISGKVVAITGGARGIGAATAREFVASGARVVLGDIDGKLVRETASEIGRGTIGLDLDVTDRDSFVAFLDAVESTVGPIDVLVNNAGIMPIVRFDKEDPASIRRQVDINIVGVLWGSQLAIQRMLGRGTRGHIVNVASAAGKLTFPGVTTYNATKFAVVGLTEALSAEYREAGITFTVVMPALVRTELASGVGEHWALRTSDPEKVAESIVRASDRRTFEVAVPGELKVLYRVAAVLPHSLSAFAVRALGGDSFIADASGADARAAYEQRAAGVRVEKVEKA